MPATNVRSKILAWVYKNVLKKIFFAFDPELVHDTVTIIGRILGSIFLFQWLTSALLNFKNKRLEQNILGMHFKNPVGLAAGFDKNAQLTEILPFVGFGFEEVGSITAEPCKGNPKPRLWRLKKSQSLLVYYGLKNRGCEIIAKKLSGKNFKFPLGVSIAKTNSPNTVTEQQGIEDYVKAYKAFIAANAGDYFTINISCPNTFGGQPFTDPLKLERLLGAIALVQNHKPIFIKMPAELEPGKVDEIINIARRYKLAGFICTNLAKNRNNKNIHDTNFSGLGGMSGKVVGELSDNLVAYIYRQTRGEFVIIGCGGVFTAEDAYTKIKLGANLIQLITGMVYMGPQVIGDINRGLVELLERDGYANISNAIGSALLK
jgi:dihydroorotate dehydrogenase